MKQLFLEVIQRGGYDLEDLIRKIKAYHIGGDLTDEDRDELFAAAAAANIAQELPDAQARMQAVEERLAALEADLIAHGWRTSEAWPLVTGTKFGSADSIRHTGDRVSMLPDGEETVRHYICKLNPTWEGRGTVYTPAGNAGSWWEATGKTEDEITAYLTAWVAKFPDFDGWTRDEIKALKGATA